MNNDFKNPKFRVGIIGMGPVGQILAVHFREAGCEVAITDLEKDKLNLIRREGIELVGKIEKKTYFKHVYNSASDLLEHDFNVFVFAIKAYHIDEIIRKFERSSQKNIYILSVQNGIGIRKKYTSHFQESKILRMVVNFAGYLQAPDVAEVSFFNPPNYIGSVDDSNPELAKKMADILTRTGLVTEQVDSFNLDSKIWEKIILNAAISPLCAISRLTIKEAIDNTDVLEIAEQIIYETLEVARAENIRLPKNFAKLCIRYLRNAGNHMPSLAIDLINNRATEIDFMNGMIVEYGKKHNIKTPLNLILTNIVRAITHKNGYCGN